MISDEALDHEPVAEALQHESLCLLAHAVLPPELASCDPRATQSEGTVRGAMRTSGLESGLFAGECGLVRTLALSRGDWI
jgi:hypothetical protein